MQCTAGAAPAELRRKLTQARKLRDKWRDQAESQRRQTQERQTARATSSNARTEKKAELFAELLHRFEERLERAESQPSPGAKTAPRGPSRRTRTRAHWDERSATRKSLKRAGAEWNAGRR